MGVEKDSLRARSEPGGGVEGGAGPSSERGESGIGRGRGRRLRRRRRVKQGRLEGCFGAGGSVREFVSGSELGELVPASKPGASPPAPDQPAGLVEQDRGQRCREHNDDERHARMPHDVVDAHGVAVLGDRHDDGAAEHERSDERPPPSEPVRRVSATAKPKPFRRGVGGSCGLARSDRRGDRFFLR